MLKEYATTLTNMRKIINILLTCISFWIAYQIRTSILFKDHDIILMHDTFALIIPACISWFIGTSLQNLYDSNRFVPLHIQAIAIAKSSITSFIIFLAYIALAKVNIPSRVWILIFTIVNFFLILSEHFLISLLTSIIRTRGKNNRNVVIVGSEDEIKHLMQTFEQNPAWGVTIKGIIYFNKHNKAHNYTHNKTNRIAKDLKELINKKAIDFVFFAIPPRTYHRAIPYISYCVERGLPVKVTASLLNNFEFVKPEVDKIGNFHLFSFDTVETNPSKMLIKEIMDKIIALSMLLISSPLLIFIALAIKLDSPGPIFFKQRRVGKNSRYFNMYKFRSMVTNAEKLKSSLAKQNEMSGPAFKITNDPRITRLGRFIRKTSIDELPQLLNVLKGEMSLVGPRPPLPSEVKQYSNWQRRRLSVKPGITCTWQVSGRNNINFDQWMKMDLDYIDKWSITADAKLLAKTLPAVIMQKGAK